MLPETFKTFQMKNCSSNGRIADANHVGIIEKENLVFLGKNVSSIRGNCMSLKDVSLTGNF
jgi:hypothetical protein